MSERLFQNAPLDFAAGDIPRLRKQMARELASGSLTLLQFSPWREVIHLKQALIQLCNKNKQSERVAALKFEELGRELSESCKAEAPRRAGSGAKLPYNFCQGCKRQPPDTPTNPAANGVSGSSDIKNREPKTNNSDAPFARSRKCFTRNPVSRVCQGRTATGPWHI